MSEKNANRRARNWCAVVYPDSAPSDWQQILDNLNIRWACSPLHDKDTDDDTQLKKAHWHIVLCYSGNKSFEQVKEDLAEINCPIPQICRDVRSSVRYFVHLDHPHKYQYDKAEIQGFGGFDVADIFALSTSEKHQLIDEIFDFIIEWDIKEYFDLLLALRQLDKTKFDFATDNHALFERIIKSNRHRARRTVIHTDNDGKIVRTEVDEDGCIVDNSEENQS